ncbi:MAG TPA: YihY/virulence factor BrkB family protein, partial [Chloroflexota bacterium]|nr:YihY/virulence factor BrkB family protein [Chloroflexota bacterium]
DAAPDISESEEARAGRRSHLRLVRASEQEHSDAPQVDDKTPRKGQLDGLKERLAATRAEMERHAWFRVAETVFSGFKKDRVTENAAAMTYYGVFSLFPLFLLFMSVAGIVMNNSAAAQEQIVNVIVGLLPQGQDKLREVIEGVITARGTAAGVGILALLWGALGWFKVIDQNINEIWGVSKPRSFLKGNLFALAMVAGIGGVALSSFGATAAVNLIASFTGAIPGSVTLWQAVISLLSLLTMAGVFFVLYRFAPQRKLAVMDILPAALITAVIWEVTRRALAFYLERNNMISGYGPIGAAMALLFWIYIASIIILIGAELCYAIAKERRHFPIDKEMEVVSPPGEQPTPKFAPQVGGGHYADQDKAEPITVEGSGAPSVPPVTKVAGSPRVGEKPVVHAAWQRQPEPRDAAEKKDIHLDVPLIAAASMALGFLMGAFRRRD